MKWNFRQLLLTLFLFNISSTSRLFEPCRRNQDCAKLYSSCQIISPTCAHGTCRCIPGFVTDGSECFRPVKLGEKCNVAADICVTPFSFCSKIGRCECLDKFKRAPSVQGLPWTDSLCAPYDANKYLGEICYDDSSCFPGNSFCDRSSPYSVCQCKPGFIKQDAFSCRLKRIGDHCKITSDDCWHIPNSKCLPTGQCGCGNGTKPVPVTMRHKFSSFSQYFQFEKSLACYAPGSGPSAEGEKCNFAEIPLPDDQPKYCHPEYFCDHCDDFGPATCLRIAHFYESPLVAVGAHIRHGTVFMIMACGFSIAL